MLNFDSLFHGFSQIKIGVVGDVMLDTYWWGNVERISPEAPVPIVALDHKEFRVGGAGNVALNLACLEAQVSVISVIGQDEDGDTLKDLFETNQIDTRYLLSSDARITTSKTRIISRNQHMMRLDAEITKDLSIHDEHVFFENIKSYIDREKPQVIILEDYNKGVLTEYIIRETIAYCKSQNIITTVDPKRKNFFSYQGVTIFKPNLKEVKEGLNILVDDIETKLLDEIHRSLAEQLKHDISLITLSEKGVYFNTGKVSHLLPSHIRNIADVSGAGDTVIAVASLVYACTKNVQLMAEMANIAGGIVCEEVGTVAISKAKLMEECKLLISDNTAS